MDKGHYKSASNMTKMKRKRLTKEKRKPRRAKKKQQKLNTVQIIEFLKAQSTTIKKRERSACETKLLKREKVPADTISSGSEFQIFITQLINENFVASILHMSDRILKA